MYNSPNICSIKSEKFNFSEGDSRGEPYYIVLPKSGKVPIELCLCELIGNVQKAKNETYNIWFYRNSGMQEGVFAALLLAADIDAALQKAIDLRDLVILKGEWQEAWKRHLEILTNVKLKLY